MLGDQTGQPAGALGGAPRGADETPAALIRTFLARCDVSVPALAAALRLPGDVVEAYAQCGAPAWFRFALAGVAVSRGTAPEALGWLVGASGFRPARSGRDYEASDPGACAPSAACTPDAQMGA